MNLQRFKVLHQLKSTLLQGFPVVDVRNKRLPGGIKGGGIKMEEDAASI